MHIKKIDYTKKEKTSHEVDDSMLTKQVLFDWTERETDIRGRLAMFNYAILKPAGFFNQHHHGSSDPTVGMTEVFYILSGTAMFKIDEKEFEVEDGTLIIIDKGEVHSMKNLSDINPVTYLVYGISNGGETTVVKQGY